MAVETVPTTCGGGADGNQGGGQPKRQADSLTGSFVHPSTRHLVMGGPATPGWDAEEAVTRMSRSRKELVFRKKDSGTPAHPHSAWTALGTALWWGLIPSCKCSPAPQLQSWSRGSGLPRRASTRGASHSHAPPPSSVQGPADLPQGPDCE